MTRNECEALILQKLHEIREIAAEYMGEPPRYLSMTYFEADDQHGEYYRVYNGKNGEDYHVDKPIDQTWYDGKPSYDH